MPPLVPTIMTMLDSELSIAARWRVDLAVALLVAGLVAVGTAQIEAEPGERVVDDLAFACGVVPALALAFWRRWAVVVAGVMILAIGVYLARGYPGGPAVLPVPLAMLALGYVAARKVAWIGVAALFVATAVSSLIAGAGIFFHLLLVVGWGAASVLAGQALVVRGERAAAERERVAHAQEQALARERLRIAQDVHDSVAHAMATINVQSGVAAHLVEHKPEQAAVALEAIRLASRDALEELGSILGVLRDSGLTVPTAPLASIGDVSTLVERARDDGVTVTLDQSGDITAVGPAVGAAAYRVVQEALTNTRRHAGPAAMVTVTLAVGQGGSLRITVRDDGGGKVLVGGPESGGFGLVGMRERVEASGGTLSTGPTTTAGFLVDAVWPDRMSS